MFIASFVAIETFLYSAILEKIKTFVGAPVTFTCLFLSVISVFMICNGISKASKIFFDQKDREQLCTHPVSDGMLIFSKLVFLFLNHFLTSLIFVYPILIAYGVIFTKSILFFYVCIFYPVLSFLFEIGVALILVYPVFMLLEYLKKHVILEFSVATLVLFVLTYAYSIVLSEFVNMVAGNSVSLIFTEEFMGFLAKIVDFLVPINFLTSAFIEGILQKIISYICVGGGVFILGVTIAVVMFNYVRNVSAREKKSVKTPKHRARSVTMGLAVKELTLITKNPDYIFSFSGLLVVQPFLLNLIVLAMGAIFNSGTFIYYMSLFPNFAVFVRIFVVIMVTLIINSGANQYITMEFATVKNLKIIPVDYRHQLLVKASIPFILSEASLIVSLLVIAISGNMSVKSCIFAFLLSTSALIVFELLSMAEELKIRHGKPRSSFLSTLYAYLLPFLFLVTGLLLSFNGVALWLICVVSIFIFLILGLPVVITLYRKMGDWFMSLEMLY
jgi:ABC-2 type transport system permease protein